jgi:hypothetical protein
MATNAEPLLSSARWVDAMVIPDPHAGCPP